MPPKGHESNLVDASNGAISGKVELVWRDHDVIVCDCNKCVVWPITAACDDDQFSQFLGETPEARHSQPFL